MGLENSTESLTEGSTSISTEVASISSEEPPRRRLWVCPQGFVGKDQCDASPHNSQCCGYSVPGENCGDRADDCFCYQWNCRRLSSGEVLPTLESFGQPPSPSSLIATLVRMYSSFC